MRTSDIVAGSSIFIAALALSVSVYQAIQTRQHNRRTVRPSLQLRSSFHVGARAGLRLTNVGLGPAVILGSAVTVDGKLVGEYDEQTSNVIRGDRAPRPSASTFTPGSILAKDLDEFLLYVDDYDPSRDWHAALVDLIRERMQLEIRYESLYGGKERWTATWPARLAPPKGMPG